MTKQIQELEDSDRLIKYREVKDDSNKDKSTNVFKDLIGALIEEN